MMMRKEEEQHSDEFPIHYTASQHVGHRWGERQNEWSIELRALKDRENIVGYLWKEKVEP